MSGEYCSGCSIFWDMASFGTAFNWLDILAPFSLILACLLCATGFGQVIGDNNALGEGVVKTGSDGVPTRRVIVDSCFLDDHISG